MTRTLLVTNDFPPKVGGIQSYLGELWARLDPASTVVLTASSHPDAAAYDAELLERGLRVERVPRRTLYLPGPAAAKAVDAAVARHLPDLVLYDPAVPLGLLGRRRGTPYGVVAHGAELAIPARLAPLAPMVRRALRAASVVVCAGTYPAAEAQRAAGPLRAVVQVPPGVDVDRFAPLPPARRAEVRARLDVAEGARLVVSVGRLVPRKGLDVLLEAVALLAGPTPVLAIAGEGRDRDRLRRIAERRGLRPRFLGRIPEDDKIELLGAADVFAQPCRSRWAGLEQEGFGIAFLEAAACGVAQLAGRSGGSDEAVLDGRTGRVVDSPADPGAVAVALGELLGDPGRLVEMGAAARERAVRDFDYGALARRLSSGLDAATASPGAHTGRGRPPR